MNLLVQPSAFKGVSGNAEAPRNGTLDEKAR